MSAHTPQSRSVPALGPAIVTHGAAFGIGALAGSGGVLLGVVL